MVLLTTATSATDSPLNTTDATSSSSGMDNFDKGVIAGVISAVLVTLLIVLVLVVVYLYKHKGSYRTNETDEEEEAQKALQMNNDPGEEKPEYLM